MARDDLPLAGALGEEEQAWLAACDATPTSDLEDRHRHNLPDWLATQLQEQLGAGFWPAAAFGPRIPSATGSRTRTASAASRR